MFTDAQALEAAAQMIDGSKLVTAGVAQHLDETPSLDTMSRDLLVVCAQTIDMVTKLLAKNIAVVVHQNELIANLEAQLK